MDKGYVHVIFFYLQMALPKLICKKVLTGLKKNKHLSYISKLSEILIETNRMLQVYLSEIIFG